MYDISKHALIIVIVVHNIITHVITSSDIVSTYMFSLS